jgi:hypothetical protein
VLPLDYFKKALDTPDKKYSVEELSEIREVLYKLARLDYKIYNEKVKRNEKCIDIHESEYRRAS